MAENEIRQRTQDLELLDDFIDFDKQTLMKIIDNCEQEAKKRLLVGNVPITERDIAKGAKMLRRGIRLMDSKTIWAIVFQLKKELDTLMYLQKMKREIAKPVNISRNGAEMFYNLKLAEIVK